MASEARRPERGDGVGRRRREYWQIGLEFIYWRVLQRGRALRKELDPGQLVKWCRHDLVAAVLWRLDG